MIVGCDYSTKAIDLAQNGPHGWRHVKLQINSFSLEFLDELQRLLTTWASWKEPSEELVIYIEQPWIAVGGKTMNPGTTMLMVKSATAVQVLAILCGFRVEWAHVTAWRSKVFGKGKYPKKIAKARSVLWAEENTGLDINKDDNKADACCIAAYGEMRESDDS